VSSVETARAAAVSSVETVRASTLSSVQRARVLAAERPEVAAGAAFVGGFLLAIILKRLGR
jgi:hypothetical protein